MAGNIAGLHCSDRRINLHRPVSQSSLRT